MVGTNVESPDVITKNTKTESVTAVNEHDPNLINNKMSFRNKEPNSWSDDRYMSLQIGDAGEKIFVPRFVQDLALRLIALKNDPITKSMISSSDIVRKQQLARENAFKSGKAMPKYELVDPVLKCRHLIVELGAKQLLDEKDILGELRTTDGVMEPFPEEAQSIPKTDRQQFSDELKHLLQLKSNTKLDYSLHRGVESPKMAMDTIHIDSTADDTVESNIRISPPASPQNTSDAHHLDVIAVDMSQNEEINAKVNDQSENNQEQDPAIQLENSADIITIDTSQNTAAMLNLDGNAVENVQHQKINSTVNDQSGKLPEAGNGVIQLEESAENINIEEQISLDTSKHRNFNLTQFKDIDQINSCIQQIRKSSIDKLQSSTLYSNEVNLQNQNNMFELIELMDDNVLEDKNFKDSFNYPLSIVHEESGDLPLDDRGKSLVDSILKCGLTKEEIEKVIFTLRPLIDRRVSDTPEKKPPSATDRRYSDPQYITEHRKLAHRPRDGRQLKFDNDTVPIEGEAHGEAQGEAQGDESDILIIDASYSLQVPEYAEPLNEVLKQIESARNKNETSQNEVLSSSFGLQEFFELAQLMDDDLLSKSKPMDSFCLQDFINFAQLLDNKDVLSTPISKDAEGSRPLRSGHRQEIPTPVDRPHPTPLNHIDRDRLGRADVLPATVVQQIPIHMPTDNVFGGAFRTNYKYSNDVCQILPIKEVLKTLESYKQVLIWTTNGEKYAKFYYHR